MVKLHAHWLGFGLVVTILAGVLLPVALPSQAQYFRPGMSQNRSMANQYFLRGKQRYDRGDLQAAVTDFSQAIRYMPPNDPNLTNLYVVRGMTLAMLKDYRSAQFDLDQAIRLNPGNATAYHGRGLVREKLQDLQGAMADYEQTLRLKPGDTKALTSRERLSQRLGNSGTPRAAAAIPTQPEPAFPRPRSRPGQPVTPPNIPVASPNPPVAVNTPPINVYQIANQTTVRIDGQNPGSGVIISRSGNTYYVLTAKHVVATPDEYAIVTANGKKFLVDYKEVKKFNNLDLAVLQFKSSDSFPIAQLASAEPVKQGDNVFVSGWPAVNQGLTRSSHQVTDGRITGFQQGDADGYELTYSNPTGGGMSGGPVFNANGQVIGIHGRAAGNQEVGKIGINLGIPVQLFFRQAAQAGLDIKQLGLRTQR
jgi:serine protease Do